MNIFVSELASNGAKRHIINVDLDVSISGSLTALL